MNKLMKKSTIFAVMAAVLALFVATAAFAQGPANPGSGNRNNQTAERPQDGMGLMAVNEADMHVAIASALGMSIEEFETAVANGETAYTLADARGIDFAVIWAAMEEVHAAALQQAVNDGLVSQDQADWMLSRRGGNGASGQGMQGSGAGQQGQQGRGGSGGFGGNSGDCPNV